jgi:two-component system response regulator HydG
LISNETIIIPYAPNSHCDDDLDICLLLSRFLAKNGYEVVKAHTGRSALNQIQESKFDLILCDFRLGDLDGLEMLAGFNEVAPEVPVIIITGTPTLRLLSM